MKIYLAEYGIAVVAFLAIDYIWLRTMGPTFYAGEIGPLLRDTPNIAVALAFYLLFVAGLVVFVIHPAVVQGNLQTALMKGAFFGLEAYATYDLTNLATIKGFTARVAVLDMVWGAVLSAAVSSITLLVMRAVKFA